MPLNPGLRPTARARSREAGVVLLVVLFFALLLTGSIATFLRRSTVDSMIARNRDAAAQAEALARGGVRLATALLLQDRLLEDAAAGRQEARQDVWALASERDIELGAGVLRLRIEDTGSRLNVNALFESDGNGGFQPRPETEPFLIALLEKVVEEMPIDPAAKTLYEPRVLAENLMDYVDTDDLRRAGGAEDDFYLSQDPPYRAWNQPLMSVEQLGEIEGFDAPLVAALKPYLSVYPFAPGGCNDALVGCGVNLNTAPPHVLAILYYDDGVDQRLASEDVVRELLKVRQDGRQICGAASVEACTPISEIVTNPIFPPPTFTSEIFVVQASAQVGEVRRSVEAVVDRSQPEQPRLLSWHVQ